MNNILSNEQAFANAEQKTKLQMLWKMFLVRLETQVNIWNDGGEPTRDDLQHVSYFCLKFIEKGNL